MTDLAVYDMDKTVTRRPTYGAFLMHCAVRRGPWRLLLLPFEPPSVVAYALKLIDRAQLKEINHRLLLGHVHPHELAPRLKASPTAGRDQYPAGCARSAQAGPGRGRRLVLATASYRLYAEAIAKRLGFDDVIGTSSVIGLDQRVHAKIDGESCYGPASSGPSPTGSSNRD